MPYNRAVRLLNWWGPNAPPVAPVGAAQPQAPSRCMLSQTPPALGGTPSAPCPLQHTPMPPPPTAAVLTHVVGLPLYPIALLYPALLLHCMHTPRPTYTAPGLLFTYSLGCRWAVQVRGGRRGLQTPAAVATGATGRVVAKQEPGGSNLNSCRLPVVQYCLRIQEVSRFKVTIQ